MFLLCTFWPRDKVRCGSSWNLFSAIYKFDRCRFVAPQFNERVITQVQHAVMYWKNHFFQFLSVFSHICLTASNINSIFASRQNSLDSNGISISKYWSTDSICKIMSASEKCCQSTQILKLTKLWWPLLGFYGPI